MVRGRAAAPWCFAAIPALSAWYLQCCVAVKISRLPHDLGVTSHPEIRSHCTPSEEGLPPEASLDFLLAVFPADESTGRGRASQRWFQNALRSFGATVVDWTMPPDAADRAHALQQVLGQCSNCDHIYVDAYDKFIDVVSLVAALPNRNKAVIMGNTVKTIGCRKSKYDTMRHLSMDDARHLDVLVVPSEHYKELCPSLRGRMVWLPHYHRGVPSQADLAHMQEVRMAELEALKSSKRTELPYIFVGGESDRDYSTLLRATRGLKVSVRVYNGGHSVPECNEKSSCEVMSRVTPDEYSAAMSDAILVAVPVVGMLAHAPGGAGLTTIQEAVRRGKFVVTNRMQSSPEICAGLQKMQVPDSMLADMCDGSEHDRRPEGYIYDGYNGFVVDAYDYVAWRNVIQTVVGANVSVISEYESHAFDVAKQTLSQEAIVREFACAMQAARGWRASHASAADPVEDADQELDGAWYC